MKRILKLYFLKTYNLIIQQIAAWPDEILNLEKLFADQLGSSNIDFNRGENLNNNSLWRMEPSKWWVLGSTIEVQRISEHHLNYPMLLRQLQLRVKKVMFC